ncbi:hypothetical protein FVEN_g7430 [Fusarium venenatum]|nr:hypothetical protein FVEN_g7430 [Fusarium venenatum]
MIQQLGGVDVAIEDAKVDLWGNVRAPEITQLPDYDSSDPYSWIKVPSDQLVTYESLIGIPILGMPSNSAGNFTLQVSASYMALQHWCSSWFNTSEWLSRIPNGLSLHKVMNDSITEERVKELNRGKSHTYMDIPRINGDFNFSSEDRYSIGPVKRGTLVFDRTLLRKWSAKLLVFVIHAAEASVPDTKMPTNGSTAPTVFIVSLPWLTHTFHAGVTSPFENYLADPALSIGDDMTGSFGITTEFTRLPLKVFVQRLAFIINTAVRVSYWEPAVLAFGNVNMTDMDDRISKSYAIQYINTTGDFITSEERYEVQKTWMAIYIFSLVLMGASILATVTFSLATRAPDFLTNISALTRDSIYTNIPQGGSTYCGDDRARLLTNRRLKI